MLFQCKLWLNIACNTPLPCLWNNEISRSALRNSNFTRHVWTWRFIINSFHTINTEFYYLGISSRSSCLHHCAVPSDFFTISLVLSKEHNLTLSFVRTLTRGKKKLFWHQLAKHIHKRWLWAYCYFSQCPRSVRMFKFRQIMVLVLFSTVSVNSSVGVFGDGFFFILGIFGTHANLCGKHRINIAHRQVNRLFTLFYTSQKQQYQTWMFRTLRW